MAAPAGAGWQADAAVGPNETYTGNRLLYNRSWEVETAFASRVTFSALRSFLLRAFFVWALVYVLGALISLAADGTSGAGETVGAWAVIAFLAGVATFFIPYREAISEWRLAMDGKAALAESAYAVVYRALVSRNVPATIEPRRVRDRLRPGAVRNLLTIRQDRYVIYVGIFSYGNDLYLGWTMWRVQLPVGMFFGWIGDSLSALAGRGSLFHLMLRSLPGQALRESLHSALREGIESAALNEQVPLAATFGEELPIEDWGGSSQRVPGQRAPLPAAADAWPHSQGR